jgi:hypothetical protein
MDNLIHPIIQMILNGVPVLVKPDKPKLTEDEAELAQALMKIASRHGKFNEDGTGIWAGYEPPAKNEDAGIGVKCSNCVLYQAGTVCKIIAMPVHPEGKCRFAVIPDGVVKAPSSGKPEWHMHSYDSRR